MRLILVILNSIFFVTSFAQNEIDESLSGNEVVNLYIKAIGGRSKAKTIKHAKIKLYVQIDESEMNGRVYIIDNEKYYMLLKSGADTVQTHIYDGHNSYYIDMDGIQQIRGKEFERMKLNSIFFPELKYKQLGYTAEMEDIETLNKRETYKVKITRPNNSYYYNYYDGITGLKLQTEETILAEKGKELKQTILYREYKLLPRKNVKYPFKKIILTNKYNIYMKVLGIDISSKPDKNKFVMTKNKK